MPAVRRESPASDPEHSNTLGGGKRRHDDGSCGACQRFQWFRRNAPSPIMLITLNPPATAAHNRQVLGILHGSTEDIQKPVRSTSGPRCFVASTVSCIYHASVEWLGCCETSPDDGEGLGGHGPSGESFVPGLARNETAMSRPTRHSDPLSTLFPESLGYVGASRKTRTLIYARARITQGFPRSHDGSANLASHANVTHDTARAL